MNESAIYSIFSFLWSNILFLLRFRIKISFMTQWEVFSVLPNNFTVETSTDLFVLRLHIKWFFQFQHFRIRLAVWHNKWPKNQMCVCSTASANKHSQLQCLCLSVEMPIRKQNYADVDFSCESIPNTTNTHANEKRMFSAQSKSFSSICQTAS